MNLQVVNNVPGLKKEEFDDHFVVIEACERIQVASTLDEKKLVNDDSTNFLRGKKLPANPIPFMLSRQSELQTYVNRPSSSIPGSQMTESPAEQDHRKATTNEIARLTVRSHYKHKVHCRTLSEFAGYTLQEVKDWTTVLNVLIKSTTGEALLFPQVRLFFLTLSLGISFMHSAGVVHRDISPGNLLIQGDKVKVNDLEYAKIVFPIQPPSSDSVADMKMVSHPTNMLYDLSHYYTRAHRTSWLLKLSNTDTLSIPRQTRVS